MSSDTHAALVPAKVQLRPKSSDYLAAHRTWQGVPSMERTDGGRCYVCFYTGGHTEESGNYVLVIRGRKQSPPDTWEDAFLTIVHDDPEVRCFDPCLWIDPMNRLWITWTQSRGFFDGRRGVWAIVSENPDDEEPVFSPPRRIANGLMMNKPIVLQTGEWCFPIAVRMKCFAKATEAHPELLVEEGTNVYLTKDQGQTFELKGGADLQPWTFDEHMIIEKADHTLWMLIRASHGIAESFSYDGGWSWTPVRESGITGPNSRFFIRRLRSGRLLLINHFSFGYGNRNAIGIALRNNLIAQLSEDDGKSWIGALVLDTRNHISYPDGKEDDTGLIHIVYDHGRFNENEIVIAAFREEDVLAGHLVSSDGFLKKVVSKASGGNESSLV